MDYSMVLLFGIMLMVQSHKKVSLRMMSFSMLKLKKRKNHLSWITTNPLVKGKDSPQALRSLENVFLKQWKLNEKTRVNLDGQLNSYPPLQNLYQTIILDISYKTFHLSFFSSSPLNEHDSL